MTLTVPPLPPALRGRGVTAVLGPTNTGKTTLAIERMLAHPSAIIGLPLRLLAREVYGKVVARAGEAAVSLITGEEKIRPPGARFHVCTVEAMPQDLHASFLALDEIQISGDLERGHVFTDRLLNRRGRDETMLLGAATMRGAIEKLVPGAHIITRPRLSNLSFGGERKITRLPRRSAIVAFSANEVYAIAELIRRQRGGAAVVLGALSPRTRNAQVEIYQSGDVDYLVATDAIGMGLNLDIDHVAFAADRKYDGYQYRRLNPVEFAQIAGRAGRSTRDGTFGTTGRCPPMEEELVQALEAHAYDGVKTLQWRNAHLDFTSIETLRASLDQLPTEQGLTRAPIADDQRVLDLCLGDIDIRARAKGREAVERLWDVCLIPDYRKISPASHADIVIAIYAHLTGRKGRIPSDWLAAQVAFADRDDGDIDTLSNRIAHIRTWTFAAARADWVDDPAFWAAETRRIEDKLSDALHQRLTQRFVDRRTSVLLRRLRENAMLEAEITKTGEVIVEGQHVGRLDGFRFAPDPTAGDGEAGKALRAAAQKALAGAIDQRAEKVAGAADDAFILSNDGTIRWQGQAIAKLSAGETLTTPRVRILADEQLSGPPREAVQTRLDLYIKTRIEKHLGPVLALQTSETLQGLARGVAFQIGEALGVIERQKVANDVKALDQEARAALRKLGVRFGAYHLYLPATMKPAPRALALQLFVLKHGSPETKGLDELPLLAASGRTSIAVDPEIDRDLYRLVGFRALGQRAVRVDILERLADIIRPALAWKPGAGPEPAGHFPGGGFTATVAMTSLVGCSGEDFASILKGLGYRMEKRPAPPKPVRTETTPAPAAPAAEADLFDPSAAAVIGGEADDAVVAGPMDDSEPVTVSLDPAVAPADPAGAVVDVAGQDAPAEAPATQETEALAGAVVDDGGIAAPTTDETDQTTDASADADADTAEAGADAVSPVETTADATADDAEQTAAEPAADDAAVPEPGAEPVPAEGAALAEPVLVEVWRPGGRQDGERPPRREFQGRRGERRGAPAAAAADGAAPVEGEARRPFHRDRRPGGDRGPRPEGDRGPRPDRPRRDERAAGEAPSGDRPPRPDRPPRDGRRDDRREDRLFATTATPQERGPRKDKEPDPLSPFAKLAALKDALQKKP